MYNDESHKVFELLLAVIAMTGIIIAILRWRP